MLSSTPLTPAAFAEASGSTVTAAEDGDGVAGFVASPDTRATFPVTFARLTGSDPAFASVVPDNFAVALPEGHVGFGACHEGIGVAFS
jgi:hypothetical protein